MSEFEPGLGTEPVREPESVVGLEVLRESGMEPGSEPVRGSKARPGYEPTRGPELGTSHELIRMTIRELEAEPGHELIGEEESWFEPLPGMENDMGPWVAGHKLAGGSKTGTGYEPTGGSETGPWHGPTDGSKAGLWYEPDGESETGSRHGPTGEAGLRSEYGSDRELVTAPGQRIGTRSAQEPITDSVSKTEPVSHNAPVAGPDSSPGKDVGSLPGSPAGTWSASLAAAITMYSRIPVPGYKWSEGSSRMMLGFFPAVGAVEGLCFMACFIAAWRLGFGEFLRGAMLTAVTIIVTGGIHLDGFCDVHDALASYAGADKKRAIMKDPHTGAFAVIHVSLCMILLAAGYSCLQTLSQAAAVALGFVLSRAVSGLCAFLWRDDLLEGSLKEVVRMSDRTASMIILALFGGAAAAGIFLSNIVCGATCTAAVLLCLGRYRHVCMENFGGFSGDCAGWLLVRCELSLVYAVVIAGYLMKAAGM